MNYDFKGASFYDGLCCLVVLLDRQSNIWFMNRFGLDRLGYERLGELFGKPLHDILPDDEAKSSELLAIVGALKPRRVQAYAQDSIESDLLRHDGSRIPMSWNLRYQDDGPEQIAPTMLLGFDASSIRQSQAVAELFQTVSDNYSGSILITDAEKRILYANAALLRLSGYDLSDLSGQTPALFKSGETSDEVYRGLWEAVDSGGIWTGEMINRRKDGAHFRESKTISAIRDSLGRVQHYFAIGEDASQRQHFQKRIDTLLAIDQLTGLPNRTAFFGALFDALERAQREVKEATVLHVDVDEFFAINEAVGNNEADLVMVEIATRIRGALRQADLLARIGNDKFAVLLGPHDAGIESDISDVAERVLAAIRRPIEHADRTLQVTASIGIAGYPDDGDSAGDLLTRAMTATERTKANGGDAFARFDAASASTPGGRRTLLNELRSAIERNELVLHYQPQVSLFSGAIVGLEALVRWQHPQRGLIPPGEFIPLIEHSSQIVDLGNWVLRETCRQMREWATAGLPPTKVAVNLSARHFVAPNLHLTIADALAGMDARYLEVEITEGAMMYDVAAAIRSTTLLKEIGVRISLDDFGTGFSSLAYLSRFPIDVVKIDQSFVQDITSNPVNAAIAQATIAMSHKLGKVVLAEGVETEEQMQYLRRNECDEMQGFFFSKPLPAEGITRMLQARTLMNVAGTNGADRRDTVLLVDDEANILASLKRTLRREGYDILTAANAEDGFSQLAKNDVQVVVSDQRMPAMSGTEFLARVKSLYPKTVRMVLSGYSEISTVTDAINKGSVYRFMMKPWDDEKLKEEIAGALRHWREQFGTSADNL